MPRPLHLLGLAVLLRLVCLSFVSLDMRDYFIPWLRLMMGGDGGGGLGQEISNYTPFYLYQLRGLAWLLQHLPGLPPPLDAPPDWRELLALKGMAVVWDLAGCFVLGRMARRAGWPAWRGWLLGALAPTVILNASLWGQVDMAYTALLLAAAWLLATDRQAWGMLAWALACCVKLQAVFLGPFVLAMCFRSGRGWWLLAAPPACYLLLAAPAWLAGRPWRSLLGIYVGQVGLFTEYSLNAPTLFNWIAPERQELFARLSFPLLGMYTTLLCWLFSRQAARWTPERLYGAALFTVTLCPFLLPRMHERYFFPADVLALGLVCLRPTAWPVAAVLQLTSGVAYAAFLFAGTETWPGYFPLLQTASILVATVLGVLAWHVWRGDEIPPTPQ